MQISKAILVEFNRRASLAAVVAYLLLEQCFGNFGVFCVQVLINQPINQSIKRFCTIQAAQGSLFHFRGDKMA